MTSFLTAAPDTLAAASSNLTSIGSSIRAASAAAVPTTTSVLVAAHDEVSAAVAALFSLQGQEFQSLIGQAGLFHEQFVQSLTSGAGLYAAQEVLNAAAAGAAGGNPLTELVNAAQPFGIFSPVAALTGRSLFVNGANASTPGGAGGVGGWLIGNGGNGATGAAGTAASPTGGHAHWRGVGVRSDRVTLRGAV